MIKFIFSKHLGATLLLLGVIGMSYIAITDSVEANHLSQLEAPVLLEVSE